MRVSVIHSVAVLGIAIAASACKSTPKSSPETGAAVATVPARSSKPLASGEKSSLETRAAVATVPDWFSKPPAADDRVYGVATSESRDLQIAIDKATAACRSQMAQQMETKYGGIVKRFQEEVGPGSADLIEQFTTAYKFVSSQNLNGTRVKEQQVVPGEGSYRAYVLMEMPIGEANRALMAKLAAQQAVFTRFRSTEVFRELNAELEKYEASTKPPVNDSLARRPR